MLRPNSQASEGFRSLRTALLLASAGTPPKTVLIASAVPGEGKTTVSMNIAAALAQRSARVLLVDADLRRGVLAERLEMPRNSGLSGSLTGAVPGATWSKLCRTLPIYLFSRPARVRRIPLNCSDLSKCTNIWRSGKRNTIT